MGSLEPLITRALTDLLASPAFEPSGKWKASVCLMAMTGFLLSAGLIFLLIGLHAYLQTIYSEPQAAAMTGGAAFVLAMMSGGIFLLLRKKKNLRQQMPAHSLNEDLISTLTDMADELEEPIIQNPRTSVLLAGLAGYMVGGRLR